MKPYMKDGLQWEDPLDGKGPKRNRSQRKGVRQKAKGGLWDILSEDQLECALNSDGEETHGTL